MNNWRNRIITVFVILWSLAFHYESIRHFYLEIPFKRHFPKIKFLFPPAGWIMFYHVDAADANVRIFGFKGGQGFEIDPHEVFRVRTIGYDNIHRGVVSAAASNDNKDAFCRQLHRRFKDVDSFRVIYTYYPNFIKDPFEQYEQILYSCQG